MLRQARRLALFNGACIEIPQWAGRRAFSSSGLTRQHDRLNILFCGADEFSICSLRALRELQSRRPDTVESIDVVCRPDKPSGRGLKQFRQGSTVQYRYTLYTLLLTRSSTHQTHRLRAGLDSTPDRHLQRLVATHFDQSGHSSLLRPSGASADSDWSKVWRSQCASFLATGLQRPCANCAYPAEATHTYWGDSPDDASD